MHVVTAMALLATCLATGGEPGPAVPPQDPTPQVPASGPYELQRAPNRKERRAMAARARKGTL